MKIFLSLVLFTNIVFAQSNKLSYIGTSPTYELKTPTGVGFEHRYQNSSISTYLSLNEAWFQTNSFHGLVLQKNFSNTYNYININLDEDVQIKNKVRFGATAPLINVKEYSGTTSFSTGQGTPITISENPDNVLSIRAMVNCGPAGYVSEEYKFSAGYQFSVYVSGNTIWVFNSDFNSSNILLKPFKLFVTYKN
jgi:hypothetical protein